MHPAALRCLGWNPSHVSHQRHSHLSNAICSENWAVRHDTTWWPDSGGAGRKGHCALGTSHPEGPASDRRTAVVRVPPQEPDSGHGHFQGKTHSIQSRYRKSDIQGENKLIMKCINMHTLSVISKQLSLSEIPSAVLCLYVAYCTFLKRALAVSTCCTARWGKP